MFTVFDHRLAKQFMFQNDVTNLFQGGNPGVSFFQRLSDRKAAMPTLHNDFIAAQRLMRKLCTDCKEPYVPPKDMAERYGLFDKDGKVPTIYKAKGCGKCLNSGYQGRIGIIECLKVTPDIKELLFKGAEELEVEKVAREEGMVTLRESGIKDVVDGLTSLEEVLRVTVGDRGEDA